MEDKNRNTEMDQEKTKIQAEESEKNKEETGETPQNGLPMRSCIVMVIAGLYLLYTGYRLCQNVVSGVEGGHWGFFAAGVGFFVVGAVMLIIGGKNILRREKEKREAAEQEIQNYSQTEEQQEQKSMSITERARLTEALSEKEEEEREKTVESKELEK